MISPDLPLARVLLSVVLALLIGLLVWRAVRKDRREYRRFKRLRSSAKRRAMYRKWLIDSLTVFGGASVVVLLLVWPFVGLLQNDVDGWSWVSGLRSAFTSSGGVGVGIVVAIVVLVGGGSVLAIVLARKMEAVTSVGDIQSLLPRNRAELAYGAALSVNAGVVEELMFRLALPALLFGVTSNAVVAIVASLLVFGALHIYQGAAGIIGSTIIGTVLMAVYLGTGSILAAIVLHALIDLRSLVLIPVIVLGVHRRAGNYSPPPARRPQSETVAPEIPPL